jgi:hypothetical protein
MVAALTENLEISHYAQRKRALRASMIAAGSPVVDVAIADKIASLRHAQVTRSPVTDRKLRHYRLTLQLALIAGLAPVLCGDMQSLLAEFARFSAPAREGAGPVTAGAMRCGRHRARGRAITAAEDRAH